MLDVRGLMVCSEHESVKVRGQDGYTALAIDLTLKGII